MKTLAMIKYTLYEYLHGIGFIILLLLFGMIFLVFGIGLSAEESITGEKITFLGLDMFGNPSLYPPEFRSIIRAGPAWFIQYLFVRSAIILWGPMFFIIIGARVIESLLSQGGRHLLLSKPMYRWHLFLARLAGFMLFSAIIIYLFLGGLWLIVGIKTGHFIYQPFVAIPVILLVYLSLISIVALVTLLIENFYVGAGITVAFYIVTAVLGQLGPILEENATLYFGWTILHGALPKISELHNGLQALYGGQPAALIGPILTTVAFCAVVIGITAFIFTRKDY